MLARLRKAREEGEGGFTLIELLVVVIIIGILAAIAIPVFLNQRKKAYDAAIKSDLKSAATAEEAYLTNNPSGGYFMGATAGTLAPGDLLSDGLKFSSTSDYDGGTQAINVSGWAQDAASGAASATSGTLDGGFCLVAKSSTGNYFVYNSTNGGLDNTAHTTDPTATSCVFGAA
ncbi:MAG TPA: prepilin-type N-terminal cleavage/methylation domain-containing protein [Mycobacteriales bacterium]|nr:prepilin-type N-terminal cleavage/methylation domain-containing protein [Mycobacteriales bacterium]